MHKLILKLWVHTPFAYAWYSSHFSSQCTSRFSSTHTFHLCSLQQTQSSSIQQTQSSQCTSWFSSTHFFCLCLIQQPESFLAKAQADPQAHTSFAYAWYSSHLYSQHKSQPFSPTHAHFVCLCFIHQPLSSQHPSWSSSCLWLSITWLLAPGPGVDEGLRGFGFPVLRSKQCLLFLVQLLAGGAIAAAVGTTRSIAALACQHFHVAVVLPCGTCSRQKMGAIRTTADATGILFFNKGAVLRHVQKCHNVMVLSQVTLCNM